MKFAKTILSVFIAMIMILSAVNVVAFTDNADNGYKADVNKILNTDERIGCEIEVEADGEYELHITFNTVSESTQRIEYAVKIDGEYPFDGAELLEAPVIYEDDGDVRKLSNGDQTAPRQRKVEGYITSAAYDKTGVRLTPYTVNLTAGEHTVEIENIGDDFELAAIVFSKPETVKPYSEVSKEYSKYDKYEGDKIIIEAEDVLYRNDYSLTAKSDTGSADITPKSATNSIINYIGGSNWSSPFKELTWQIDVPKTALYKLGFNFKQNSIINGNAYRWLKIDGKTPFKEAAKLGFSYKTAWQYKDIENADGEDYLFYLTEGKHTLSLDVTLAGIADIYDKLNDITADVGELYLDIVMITGETPDANRDYELYKQIPDFEEKLKVFYNDLTKISNELNSKKDINGELDGAVKNVARISKLMSENRYESHLYLDTYFSYYQTLSSWLFDIKNMALSLDKIIISAPEREVEDIEAGFFESFAFGFKRFLLSFLGDYSNESLKGGSNKNIKIWVNWGRDQVKVLNTLIQEDFSPGSKINVKVEQVNASVVQGIISNNSPDLYLHMARTEPINLAMRGVLHDLSSFSDYEEVLNNFQKGAEKPYIYKGKTYALPDVQGFSVMFVRTDIFNELGLEIPQTWDDYLSATSVIQRKNMNTYLPHIKIVSATTVNTGAGGLSIFPTLLMQNGESMYNSELNATNLASPISVKAFKFWTDFYTRYKLNPDANFYQRFRVGTIPLGIASYTQYLTFAVAAPEIEGKWAIYELPGVKREDGTIDRSCAGSGTGCAIMKSSKDKKSAWEFLKWWVSPETQYNYSFNCEAVLGQSGRTATATVEALKKLSWDKESLAVILKQWQNVKEIEEVPGSYYVSRSIDQAFWAVYNGEATEKEAITEWSRISNSEIERKISEYKDRVY
ncbi:MAG: extracellular solute-binding protein [Ruminococcaceae bacterium]|nr:extracellular solute-binding protein [Oscillospiraceae bacterium]